MCYILFCGQSFLWHQIDSYQLCCWTLIESFRKYYKFVSSNLLSTTVSENNPHLNHSEPTTNYDDGYVYWNLESRRNSYCMHSKLLNHHLFLFPLIIFIHHHYEQPKFVVRYYGIFRVLVHHYTWRSSVWNVSSNRIPRSLVGATNNGTIGSSVDSIMAFSPRFLASKLIGDH